MIPKNALTMRGSIERCWLLALRVPPQAVAGLLPPPLRLVEFGGYAFFNVVISELSHMRPAPLPAWMGIRYRHVAYRLYARFEEIEGLYFLRSDADRPIMVAAGNLLTDFRFHPARIGTEGATLRSEADGARLRISLLEGEPRLAAGSPFEDLRQAERFLKYKPAGVSAGPRSVDVLRITRDEHAWRARLRDFRVDELSFLDRFQAVPELLYEMEPIDYQWNRAERFPVRP